MDGRGRRRAVTVAGVVLAVLTVAGCDDGEDIGVWNTGSVTVDVRLGDEDVREVTPDGGAVLLEPAGCYAPVVVAWDGGRTVELDGPICPGQTLAVDDGTARIRERSTGG